MIDMSEQNLPMELYRKIPRYEKIALDIAYDIYHGHFQEGEKVRGRSTLASKYNVSPETIRRSMKILSDMEVVETIEKKGSYIQSKEKAYGFIQEYQLKNQVLSLKENIHALITQQQDIEKQVMENLDSIIEHSLQLRNIGLIYPLEIKIQAPSHIIGKSIAESRFWHHTGATIVGISQDGKMVYSPDPQTILREGTKILFVGSHKMGFEKVQHYIDEYEPNQDPMEFHGYDSFFHQSVEPNFTVNLRTFCDCSCRNDNLSHLRCDHRNINYLS